MIKISSIFVLCTALCWGAQAQAAQLLDRIVAVVNNDVITEKDLNTEEQIWLLKTGRVLQEAQRVELRSHLLNNLIATKVQLQLARASGITVDDGMLAEQLQRMRKTQGGFVDEFRHTLQKEHGVPFEAYQERIRQELVVGQLQARQISSVINISKEEVQSFLQSPAGQAMLEIEYHLAHVVLEASELSSTKQSDSHKASQLGAALQACNDLTTFAQDHSTSTDLVRYHDFGWRKISDIPGLFIKHLSTMKIGEIAGPFQSSNGWHLIKLLAKKYPFGEKVETHVRHILLTDAKLSSEQAKTQLLHLKKEAEQQHNFTDLAKQYSQEAETADKGGDLGWLDEKAVPAVFLQKMQVLAPGEISPPFQTDAGWHLIEVVARRNREASIEDMQERAKQVLFNRKFEEKLVAWINHLREEANIVVY